MQAQPNEVDNLADSSPASVGRGYDDILFATTNLASGEGTVAGKATEWTLQYMSTTGPWFLPGKKPVLGTRKGIASECPTYSAGVTLDLCLSASYNRFQCMSLSQIPL